YRCEVVCAVSPSSDVGPGGIASSEIYCLGGFLSEPVLLRILVWHSGRVSGRDRLDGICLPQDAGERRPAFVCSSSRNLLVAMASASHKLSGCVSASWEILATLLLGVCIRNDGNASAHLLAILAYP